MSAEATFVVRDEDMRAFRDLSLDDAPVHWDADFARTQGYRDRIVYGFLVAARFSALLGARLPGPRTVIHSVRFEFVSPVYVDESVVYVVKVIQVARSVRTVVLDLTARRPSGEIVARGSAQCGF